jgi:hypothetical protein
MIAMPLRDYLPNIWRKREFATVGTNPPFKDGKPRSFGAGVIKRIKLQNSSRGGYRYGGGSNKEPQIGDNRTYMNVYLSDPIIKTLIDLPCMYAAKDGYDIVTDNDEEREAITSFFDEINLEQIIYSWLRNGRIFGTGYLEYTGDNLVLRSSQNMYVQRNERGQIKYYYQDIGDDAENVRFEEDEIIEYKNNPFDDYAYGLSDIHPILYLVDLKDYAERDIGAALNKYATSRFDISAGLPDMPYGPDKINEIVSAFNTLEPGEDIIHGNDIVIKELQGTQRAFEYGKYTDDILKKIHISLKVPVTMWEKPEQARPIFEPYVKHLQAAVEASLNSQLMPQLESGKAKFSFRQINVADAFAKAKTDMIYLSEGVLSPSEVRLERGLNPEGIVEQQETAENANLSGGKDEDKSEESARTENRNLTGDREK